MTVTDPRPDLTLYRVVHRGMQGDAARLAHAVATLEPGDHRRVAAFGRWYRGYVGELHDHHEIEDDIIFPVVAHKVPSFTDATARIDREHALLAELLDRTDAALTALADGDSWGRAAVEANTSTAALRDLLDRHLGFEDDEILPLIEQVFTSAEYAELEEQAGGKATPRQLLFTIPWAIDWATDAEREHAFATTPTVFKLLWRARRGSYARLTDRVFADAPRLPVRPHLEEVA